jgi:hypothetical protein
MNGPVHLGAREIRPLINVVAVLLGLLMLLAFPMRQVHQFTDHFRASEMRRSVERHTFLAQPEADPAERVAHCALVPALPVPVENQSNVKPVPAFEFTSPVPLTRLLSRLKLGRSRAGSQDPLI